MKRSLLFKLMLCYIITVSLMFMGGNTLGNKILTDYLANSIHMQLNHTGQNIAQSSIITNYFLNLESDTEETDNILKSYLSSISHATSFKMWLLDADGNFIYNSEDPHNSSDINILDYSNRFFYLNIHKPLTINKLVRTESIFSINKIKSNNNTYGYLVLYTPNKIDSQLTSLISIMNIALILCAIIILVMFILIYFLTVQPIQRITTYAIEASQGKFNKKINIRSNDEYKDLANAIHYLTSELNNIDEYQRNFISNISHDFRSPLTSIKGYLEAMLDGTIPPENYKKYLNTILFESERLTGLTTNLLTLNQLDNTKQLLHRTDFDINYIISKTIDLYEGICQKNKITLETNFESTSELVNADQAKIQQVINNILDNAIKFSPHNSTITISTYVKVEKVFVSIKDHGQGIPKESISRIWERFYKTDTSRGKDKKGTGLGLAITKEIINAHHENINVISTVGVGTEFSFSLSKSKQQ